ncbi:MAG: sensor histidine kinase [Paenibacillaceae bacterium]
MFEMNNVPIRYKLIIHFMIISILPSICLGILISWAVNNVISKQVNANTLQLIGNANKSLESYVSEIQNITYLISFNSEVKDFLYQEQPQSKIDPNQTYDIQKFLQGFTTLHSEVAGILVLNSNNQYISNEMYARTSKNLTEEQWYKEAESSKGIFKLIGHTSGRNITTHYNYKDDEVISVVRAILDPDTQITKGVILIDLKLRVVAETIKDVRLGKSGFLMVIDSQGKSIYTPASPLVDGIQKQWFADQMSGDFSREIDGQRLEFIYRKSSFTNWTTVGVFSTDEAVSEVQEIRFYLISFIFLVTFLGVTASFYLAYSISRPIQRLMNSMQTAESGDLTIRHMGVRLDEIGMLGRSFNAMLTQIVKLISLVEAKERQKKEAELRTLHANIKPHFLYNTLDTIQWMARKNGANDVSEMVDSLAKLFRIGLSNGHDAILLTDEVEHVISYLKIQETRYRDKLTFDIQIDPAVEKLLLLKLILQPIVENAIYHGIKERRGPGHIQISISLEKEYVMIKIADDGLGMTQETVDALNDKLSHTLNEIQQQSTTEDSDQEQIAPRVNRMIGGYGIMNVHTRIVLSFGERYGVSIQSQEGKGTIVTIIHPIVADEEGEGRIGNTVESINRG